MRRARFALVNASQPVSPTSKNEWYEPLCSRHVRAIWLADCAEQGFLFRLDAATVNVADFEEEDDQAEPVAKRKANAEEHDK